MFENKTNTSSTPKISLQPKDFADVFCENPNYFVSEKIKNFQFGYEPISVEEKESYFQSAWNTIRGELIRSGAHRLNDWNLGWGENLSLLKNLGKQEAIVPKYFSKINTVRWKQEWIKPVSPDFEFRMLAIIQAWLFDKYLRTANTIYEFGCGTGHNLLRLREINTTAKLVGLDWAESSQKILEELREKNIDPNIYGHKFDFFNPANTFQMSPDSGVYTVAALEQTGTNFKPFVDFILRHKPKIILHIEPIGELLDPNHPLDRISLDYFKKRNYLSGYLDYLRSLEASGLIEIIRAHRTFIGSFFIEGYSIIAWKVI